MGFFMQLVSPPLSFRGREYRAKKKFFEGTHRLLTPQETYQKIKPYCKRIGLTRNASVTGLDRLRIPVTLAIRPNSMTVAVSSGKGLDRESALVSGIMEALELHHAETTMLPSFLLSYEEAIKRVPMIPREQ